MTAPTVEVTAKLSSFGGPALAGIVITAIADKDDNYNGLILRKPITATTDTNGDAVFDLFPNALATAALPGLGTTGSTYRFTASVPNGWRLDVKAQVPNTACDLHAIVMSDDADLPTPGEVAGAVRYNIAQSLTTPQQAQARANINFDAAVRAVALTGLSLATATAIAATDTALVAFGKAQAQITALDTAKANLSGAAFSGAVSATSFTGPLTGNVTGNVSGSAGSVAASAITGTTLAANVVTSSLTAVGTIATGVWQGTAIADTYLATISTAGKVANSATTAASANTASAIVARDSSGNFTAGTITAALTGNASTATALATPRAINGVNFDGTAAITVTAAAGTLTGATLAAGVTASSLTSVGTLTALTVSGVTSITASSASAALTVTQTGAGNAFVVEDSASTDSTPLVIDASGKLILGSTAEVLGAYGDQARFMIVAGLPRQFAHAYANDTFAAVTEFAKSRNATLGSHTIVQSGDELGAVRFAGSDGTAFRESARIQAFVDGTPGTNDMPGRLVFSTTADGASSPTERMRIDSAGLVSVTGAFTATTSVTAGTGSGGGFRIGATNVRLRSDSADLLLLRNGADSDYCDFVARNESLSGWVTLFNTTAIPAGGTAGAGLRLFSATNFGVFGGSGAPTLSAAKGSMYLRSDGTGTSDRAYLNTDGGTTWTALTTAA